MLGFSLWLMSNVPSRGTSSISFSFSSQQTNVIKDKVRITIERIRSHAENLTGVRSKDVSKLDSSKLTIEEKRGITWRSQVVIR